MKSARLLITFGIITTAAALFAGCTPVNTSISFTQTFEGYPCDGHCDQFRSGFELAKQQQYTSSNQCQTLDSNVRLGCLSYLHEYQLQANQPAGYVF